MHSFPATPWSLRSLGPPVLRSKLLRRRETASEVHTATNPGLPGWIRYSICGMDHLEPAGICPCAPSVRYSQANSVVTSSAVDASNGSGPISRMQQNKSFSPPALRVGRQNAPASGGGPIFRDSRQHHFDRHRSFRAASTEEPDRGHFPPTGDTAGFFESQATSPAPDHGGELLQVHTANRSGCSGTMKRKTGLRPSGTGRPAPAQGQ